MSTNPQATQNLLTRLTPEMAQGFRRRGSGAQSNLRCSGRPEDLRRPAVRDRNGVVSYGTLVNLAETAATELQAAGTPRPGNRVAAWLSSRLETVVFFLACSRNGYVFCPSLHRTHTADEVLELLRRMRASAFVGEEGYGAKSDATNIFGMISAVESIRKTPPTKTD